ncbi:MAG: GGDEF domain-containing protein, partial [Gammaproteobacteria bacterium]|nr:GGDEF domain-containing protein [Gammaproteobacteria bacterium]
MPPIIQEVLPSQRLTINRPSPLFELYLRAFKKSLYKLITPTVVLVAGAAILSRQIAVHPALLDFFHLIPYVFLAAALALSWRFNQGRSFFLLCILTLCYWGLDSIVRSHDATAIKAVSVYAGVCFLLPVNFAAFSWLKERGVFNKFNIGRYLVILVQIVIVALVANLSVDSHLQSLFVRFDNSGLLAMHRLPQMAQVLFFLALMALLAQLFVHRSALGGGAIGALIAMALALNYEIGGFESILYSGIASLLLLVAVVQDSYILAYHDELTGLPGRRALNEQMMRLGNKYVLAMVDVDHFKQFNDKYGHDTGDQVLRFVAAKMEAVRGGGKAYRYGGEEFTILFSGKDVPDVLD